MTVVTAWPRLMPPDLAQVYVGGRTVFDAMKKQNLIKPKVKQPRGLTLYDRVKLDAACDAFKSLEEEP